MATMCKVMRGHGDVVRWVAFIIGSAQALGGMETFEYTEKLEALERWGSTEWGTLQEA